MKPKLPKDIRDLYVDQGGRSVIFGDRRVDSCFTPYGIQCMDSEFSKRIQNLGKPVKRIVIIERTAHYQNNDKTSGLPSYWDEFIDVPLDRDQSTDYFEKIAWIHEDCDPFINIPEDKEKIRLLKLGFDYQRRKMINGSVYSYTHPRYLVEHQGEDPDDLRKEIKENPHLHDTIKLNLLDNLYNNLGMLT